MNTNDYNVKSIRKKFKEKGIFYTPTKLVEIMKSYIPNDFKYNNVYDPTCGHGNILKSFGDKIIKYGQEINEVAYNVAKNITNSNIALGDTLLNPAFINYKFDLILANPPFSISWEQKKYDWIPDDLNTLPPKSKADYAFILHCIHCLNDNGICIMLCFPGILYRLQSEYKIRKYIIEKNYIDKIVNIDANTFDDTKIATTLIVFKKNKINTDITFIDGNKTTIATLDDIKNNNYNLSTNNYIQCYEQHEKIDPIELKNNSRNLFINNLKKQIQIDSILYDDTNNFINDILNTINDIIKK